MAVVVSCSCENGLFNIYSVWNMLAWNGRGSYLCKAKLPMRVCEHLCLYVNVCEGVWERVWGCMRKGVYPSVLRLLDKLWMFCNRNCCDWMIIIRISSLSLNLRAIDWAHISAKVNMVVISCLSYTKVCALWMLFVHTRGYHLLHTRGNHLLHTRGNHLLHTRGYHLLHTMGYHLLHTRGYHLLHTRGYHLLHTRGYHLLSPWGLSAPSPCPIRVTRDCSTGTTPSYPCMPSRSSLASCDYTPKVGAILLLP